MTATPIPPVTNGVPTGHSQRGRGHRRAHGLSLTGSSLSHNGHLAPPMTRGHLRSPSSPLVQSFTPNEATLKHSPVGGHSRHHSELLSPAISHDIFYSPRSVSGFSDQALPTPVSATNGNIVREEGKVLEKSQLSLEDRGSLASGVLTGVLISFPYIALSTLRDLNGVAVATNVGAGKPADGKSHVVDACASAAIALFSLGAYLAFRSRAQYDITRNTDNTGNSISARMVITTAMSTFLPFYAACLVGGGRVAILLLATLSSGIPSSIQSSGRAPSGVSLMTLLLRYKFITLLAVILIFSDLTGMTTASSPTDTFRGYLALLLAVPFAGWERSANSLLAQMNGPRSALDRSPPEGPSNVLSVLLAGALLSTIGAVRTILLGVPSFDFLTLLVVAVPAFSSTIAIVLSRPSALQRPDKVPLFSGLGLALAVNTVRSGFLSLPSFSHLSFSFLSYVAVKMDTRTRMHPFHDHGVDSHPAGRVRVKEKQKPPSQVTMWLIGVCERCPLVHSILKEKDSRRIFYFMSLNFAFMLVQMAYGIITGSLGLLSDSIHMLFDCAALAVGLAAAVMSKWPPSTRFPYGYGKVETLAGFANGVFLMVISIQIVYEAIERLYSGSEVHRLGELFVVSTLGLLVNMVGIFAFDHAHHHGHSHGHDHSHDHGNENMHGIFLHILADALGSVAVVGSTILVHFFGWAGFDPLASCLIAILIFVSAIPLVMSTSKSLLLTLPADVEYSLRDTLGGLNTVRGVVGYTVPRFWLDDIKSDKHDHHHTHDDSHDHGHDHNHNHGHHHEHRHDSSGHCHSHSDGHHHHVSARNAPHSHTHNHDHDHSKSRRLLGVVHIVAAGNADLKDVERRTLEYFGKRNMDILVQVEREGDAQCWCGAGNSK